MKKKTLFSRDTTKRITQPKLRIGEQLTQEQVFMQELFNSERTFGTGQNLPELNGALISGYGLINNEDYGETSSMFGGWKR